MQRSVVVSSGHFISNFETNQRPMTYDNAHIIKPSELMVFSTNGENINSYEFKIKDLQKC